MAEWKIDDIWYHLPGNSHASNKDRMEENLDLERQIKNGTQETFYFDLDVKRLTVYKLFSANFYVAPFFSSCKGVDGHKDGMRSFREKDLMMEHVRCWKNEYTK